MHRLDMVLLSGPRTDQLVQLIVILEPPEHVAEAPVLPLRMSGRMAKRLPLGVVSDGDRYPVVLTPAAIDALRRVPFTAVADTLRHSARQHVLHDRVPCDRYRRLVFRQIDVLSLPGTPPVMQRRQHRAGADHARIGVGERDARLERRPYAITGDAREPRTRIPRHPVRCKVPPCARLPVTG